MRVRNVTYTRQRKKKHFRAAKGAYATKKNRWRFVKQQEKKNLTYAYVGRKDKKGNFRSLWIVRINAAARELGGITYSQMMSGLKKANVTLDRKVLADIAMNDPQGFTELAAIAKKSVSA
jgi:large subunit ribosomal protein L20